MELFKMAELVSIITPMYNSENFIEEAILSVLKQSYTNWEMLIIDDGSKDKSIEIVEKYLGRDNRIKLIKNTISRDVSNIGVADNNNNFIFVFRIFNIFWLNFTFRFFIFCVAFFFIFTSGAWCA